MEERIKGILDDVCCDGCDVPPDVLEEVLVLAVELAREGREGRKVGTLFVIGDKDAVMRRSRPLILDPLFGHAPSIKQLTSSDMKETVKELAQLDGGFVVCRDGIVHSAARYFDSSSEGVQLKLGLGSRHMAAASVSRNTSAVAVVVSESSVVRIFSEGEMVSEIIPEVWMLRRYGFTREEQVTPPEA